MPPPLHHGSTHLECMCLHINIAQGLHARGQALTTHSQRQVQVLNTPGVCVPFHRQRPVAPHGWASTDRAQPPAGAPSPPAVAPPQWSLRSTLQCARQHPDPHSRTRAKALTLLALLLLLLLQQRYGACGGGGPQERGW
eukprot:scaffold302945_cov17-Tisochrysis_lutea.AAC.1